MTGEGASGGRASAPDPLDVLLRHLRPSVYRYCRARLPDRTAAEDVTQEVTIALVDGLRRRRVRQGDARAYAFGVAARRVALFYRSAGRSRESLAAELPEREAGGPGPEELAAAGEARARLTEALAGLTDVQREVVLLRIAAGLSSEETGQVLGLSPGAVRVAQCRALARLRATADPEVLR